MLKTILQQSSTAPNKGLDLYTQGLMLRVGCPVAHGYQYFSVGH